MNLISFNIKLKRFCSGLLNFSVFQNMSTKRSLNESKVQSSKKLKTMGHWSLGLLDTMKDPNSVIREDDLVVVVKDKYPKAKFHYLVLPKENLSSLKSVTSKHKDLLKHMEKVGKDIAKEGKHEGSEFRFGYHAEASMERLHLHVISTDMNSICLKTKKHWNSYTTKFFMDSQAIIQELENEGEVKLLSKDNCDKLLRTALKCHKCDYIPKHIPDLKKHLLNHINLNIV